jgi:hypothetical protein
MTAWAGNKKNLLCLGAILLAAAAVRTVGLGWGLPNEYHVTTYNCDEYTALAALQRMNPSKLDFNPSGPDDPYAILSGTFNLYTYAALLKALSVTGWLKLSTDKEFYYQNPGEWSKFFMTGRALSVAYGLLSVLLVWLLAGKMFGARTGLLAAFFMALMPAHAVHSRYLIMNVPGTFWIVLAFYFMWRILHEGRARDYFLAGASAGLAVSTRYSALPLPLMLVLAHFLSAAPGRALKKLALGLCAAGILYLAGTPYAMLDLPGFLNGLKTMSQAVASPGHASLLADVGAVLLALSAAMGLFAFLACVPGVVLALVRRQKEDLLLLAWIALLLAAFTKAAAAASTGRVLPVLPFLAILGARFLDFAWDRLPALGRGLAAAILVSALVFYGAYFRLALGTDLRDEASAWMIANIRPGASIGLVHEPSWFSPGLIDRKYRHPGHKSLPDYTYLPLPAGDWETGAGFDRLGELKPDYVVISDVEEHWLSAPSAFEAALRGGYREEQRFERTFSFLNFKLGKKIPEMLYIPNYIRVLRRVAPAAAGRT